MAHHFHKSAWQFSSSCQAIGHQDGHSRLQEKEELQDVYARLRQYIQRVQDGSSQSIQVGDSSTFFSSVKQLEGEIQRLKTMYEAELEAERGRSAQFAEERDKYALEVSSVQARLAELQNRLQMEDGKNRSTGNRVLTLQRSLTQTEQHLQETRLGLDEKSRELSTLQMAYMGLSQEREDLQKRYECELLCRKNAEEKLASLQKSLDFQAQIHAEESQEQMARFESASAAILQLEGQIREFSQKREGSVNQDDVFVRIQAVAEGEFKRIQTETEAMYTQHLTQFKGQMDDMAQQRDKLHHHVAELNATIAELSAQLTAMAGEIGVLQNQKQAAVDQLTSERTRHHQHIHRLEAKLTEMQEMLVIKKKKVPTATLR